MPLNFRLRFRVDLWVEERAASIFRLQHVDLENGGSSFLHLQNCVVSQPTRPQSKFHDIFYSTLHVSSPLHTHSGVSP
jgi:hypothetical protein